MAVDSAARRFSLLDFSEVYQPPMGPPNTAPDAGDREHGLWLYAFDAGGGTPPTPTPIVQSTGAGGGYRKGERRARGLEWDKRDTAQDIGAWVQEAYEKLAGEETSPAVAEAIAEVVAPYRTVERPSIDWTAFVQSAEAIKRLAEMYDRHLAEIEARRKMIMEEEAAFLLMMQ